MHQAAILVIAHDQRAHRLARDRGGDVAGDHELLAFGAFRLQPVLAAAGAIGRARDLGHHALQAEPAGMPQDHVAVVSEMAAVAQDTLRFVEEPRSEEHTSELQSLMRISYAVFCLKKKNIYRVRITTARIRRRSI